MSLEKPDLLYGNKPVKASNITWSCDDVSQNESSAVQIVARQAGDVSTARTTNCPSCGHNIEVHQNQGVIHDLPAGVKFDPNDQEILEHLEAKVVAADAKNKRHPLIDEFIPTLKGENGICYTHPKKLPGVSKDGQLRHFFHQPSKAYTTGTRKRRKVLSDENGSETRWHKTGKTRPVVANGTVKGFKKILVLYTNYGKQQKPGKTNWVMHQYHLGDREEEKDGEMVVSKVFYQTQPRQCGSTTKDEVNKGHPSHVRESYTTLVKYFNNNNSNSNNNTKTFISYDKKGGEISSQLLPNLTTRGDGESSFIRCPTDSSKGKIS